MKLSKPIFNNTIEKAKPSREQKIELYNNLVASHADAIRKGAIMPYTSLNGHMYSYFTKDDFVPHSGFRKMKG